ncbi:hypothetical protein LXL04_037882 [Taraxacum kok-saghyz]
MAGSFFAFVKFAKVEVQQQIEKIIEGLKEIEIRGKKLRANYAKHPRAMAKKSGQWPTVPVERVFRPANRGARSFAEVTKGDVKTASKPQITLDCVSEIKQWADNSVLLGEVPSFDVICNFPSLLAMEGYDVTDIKYVGGMQVSMKFRTARAAGNFKANKGIWLKWFVWVDLFGKVRKHPGRIAWLKVVGVPITAWDESNFAAIAGYFGKVLVDVAPFWNRTDVSGGKICILTEHMKKINNEVEVALLGVIFKVGVIEIEDGWTPFSPYSTPSVVGSDGEDDRNSDGSENVVLEEGEYVPETQTGGFKESTENNSCRNVDGKFEKMHGKSTSVGKGFEGPGIPKGTIPTSMGGFSNFNNDGPEKQNIPNTCNSFNTGPPPLYPNNVHDPKTKSDCNPPPTFFVNEISFSTGRTQDEPDRRKKINPKSGRSRQQQPSEETTASYYAIDLNRFASPSNSKGSNDAIPTQQVRTNSPSISMDVEQTVEIGNQLGFEFGNGNSAVLESVCGGGAKQVDQ